MAGFMIVPGHGDLIAAVNPNVFPNYLTRQALRAQNLPEAPIASGALGPKYWADPNPPAPDAQGICWYERLPVAGEGNQLVKFGVAAVFAGVYNLPGEPIFEAYTPAPTGATVGGAPMNPVVLSTAAQAEAMLAALGMTGSGTVQEQTTADATTTGTPYIYPVGEARRYYNIVPNGMNTVPLNVGYLLQQQNGPGVGTPGTWNLSQPGNPVWAPGSVNLATANAPAVPNPTKPIPAGYDAVLIVTRAGFAAPFYAKFPA